MSEAGVTTDRNDDCIKLIRPDGMQECYLVLPEEERTAGHIRPLRLTYRHVVCGHTTSMGLAIAETYAKNPKFYGGTYCYFCGTHFDLKKWITSETEPMRAEYQFEWVGTDGKDGSYVGE